MKTRKLELCGSHLCSRQQNINQRDGFQEAQAREGRLLGEGRVGQIEQEEMETVWFTQWRQFSRRGDPLYSSLGLRLYLKNTGE